MNFYRFSISWARVLPHGDTSLINEAGIDYYNKLIDRLLENNIEPMVTMYHYDLPQRLQENGGLTNSTVVDNFKAYANLLYTRFGDRVSFKLSQNKMKWKYYCKKS